MPSRATATDMRAEATSRAEDIWRNTHPPSAEQILAGDVHKIALFLDCDGTLLDIAPTPDEVRIPDGLGSLLARLEHGLGGALAILTGRQLAEIDSLLDPRRFAGSGVHGAELRTTANGDIARVTSALPASLVEEVMRRTQNLPGIIAEPKGPGIAVHYRQAPHLKDSLEIELRTLLLQYPEGLVLSPGRKLYEIIPAGHSKGSALETFLGLPRFAGRRPIMIGDDLGDIPAFAAALRCGGTGLRVAGEQFGFSDVELQGPSHVLDWLERLARRLQ